MLNWLNSFFYITILLLGIATYLSMVVQMLLKQYQPSFFSRGVWFLLGIDSFAGVFFGDGSKASVILAGTLLVGNAVVFAMSYRYGSREFASVEKVSLVLLIVATGVWLVLNKPFLSLIITLVAHFIGGIPTIARAIRRPSSEQAWHWYIFFTASVLGIIASPDKSITAILFPVYFTFYEGLMIILANRPLLRRLV